MTKQLRAWVIVVVELLFSPRESSFLGPKRISVAFFALFSPRETFSDHRLFSPMGRKFFGKWIVFFQDLATTRTLPMGEIHSSMEVGGIREVACALDAPVLRFSSSFNLSGDIHDEDRSKTWLETKRDKDEAYRLPYRVSNQLEIRAPDVSDPQRDSGAVDAGNVSIWSHVESRARNRFSSKVQFLPIKDASE